jgi:TolB-like protein/DNA-binding winged helix-turn-helix (wHTH) protein/Tfp pilus assembly protein PilF
MSTSSAAHHTYTFDEFTLDLDRGALLRTGTDIKLRPKSFEVLSYLVERQGLLVTKDELLDAIWGQTVVTEEAVTHCLSEIRTAIHDQSQKMIRTVPRRGYIFDVAVTQHGGPVAASDALSRGKIASGWPRWGLVAALVLLLGVTAAWWGFGDRAAEMPATTAAHSVAVLPFVNRSASEEDAFFVDGLHDVLVTHISKIDSIKTISRTSVMQYRDTNKTIPEIAQELGVTTIMEGGVQRASDTIRINVQLIDAASDEHLWVQIYDRQLTAANIFAIQSEIATTIADSLRARLSPAEQQRLETVPTENLVALEAYFHGKQRMAKRTTGALTESVDYFQQAIELDSDFALAYVGLADSYLLQIQMSGLTSDEMFPKVEAAIDRALELDDQLGEVHVTLGRLQWVKRDFAAAEMAFKRALELNPNYANAHFLYAIFLRRVGRPEEALARIRKAQQLDPLSAMINMSVGSALRDVGLSDEALAQYKKAIEIDPAFAGAYRGIARIYYGVSGQLDEAAAWYRKAIALDPGHGGGLAELGFLYLDLGDEQQAERWISRSIELAPERPSSIVSMTLLNWYLGQDADALDYERKALAIDANWGFFLLARHDLQAGRYPEARARYERGYPALLNEDAPKIDGTNFRVAIDLAFVLTKTGEQDQANMLLARALTYIQTIPRLAGWEGYWISDIQIYALQGQTAKALAALREAIEAGWRLWWWFYLEHDPTLESIHDEPEFQAIVKEIETDMAAQLARLQEREANGELAPIPKSLE